MKAQFSEIQHFSSSGQDYVAECFQGIAYVCIINVAVSEYTGCLQTLINVNQFSRRYVGLISSTFSRTQVI